MYRNIGHRTTYNNIHDDMHAFFSLLAGAIGLNHSIRVCLYQLDIFGGFESSCHTSAECLYSRTFTMISYGTFLSYVFGLVRAVRLATDVYP